MSPEPVRTPPWSLTDARTAFLPVVLGTVLLGWAWWEASGTGKLDEQTTAMVFAVLAAAVCVAGCAAWISAGRRAVKLRRLAVLEVLERTAPQSTAPADFDGDDAFVAVAGTARYHRPDCLLTRGKRVERVSASGLRACEMCRP